MPTISECIFTISEVTYLSLQNSDFFTTLHLESTSQAVRAQEDGSFGSHFFLRFSQFPFLRSFVFRFFFFRGEESESRPVSQGSMQLYGCKVKRWMERWGEGGI